MLGLCLTLCLMPQGESPPAPAQDPAPLVETDANGWPVGEPAATAEPAASVAPVVNLPPAAPPGGAGTPLRATSLDSPLRDVWQWVGQPSDFAAQGGARAEISLHVYDQTGRIAGTRTLVHEADLSSPERDRLTFSGGRKTFGRDGPAVWAMLDNVIWHSREREASELLRVMGLLLRLPWGFAEGGYVAYPARSIDVDGQRKLLVRVESRSPDLESGAAPDGSPQDVFELICSEDRYRPEEVRYRLRESGQLRRVRLAQYQPLNRGVRVPVRRVFLSHDGRPLMEMEIVRMSFGHELTPDLFRPPERR